MSIGIGALTASTGALTTTLQGLTDSGTAATLSSPSSGGSAPFADLMTDTVEQVNDLENQAHTAVTGLISGTGVDVHQAMIAAQKADMAFELALSVRNKAVQAYQSVIGMQF
jgi:flagellar hook-basal body complex protein FliE